MLNNDSGESHERPARFQLSDGVRQDGVESQGAQHEPPTETERGPFPMIARDHGAWGVWFGPGQSYRTFETEELARAWLANLAENMNRDAWQEPDWMCCACGKP